MFVCTRFTFVCTRFTKEKKIIIRRIQKTPPVFSCILVPFDRDVKEPVAAFCPSSSSSAFDSAFSLKEEKEAKQAKETKETKEEELMSGDPAKLARLLPFATGGDEIIEFACLVLGGSCFQFYSAVDVHDRNDWFQLFDFLARVMDDSEFEKKIRSQGMKIVPGTYAVMNTFFNEELKCPFARNTCIVCNKPHIVTRFKEQCDCARSASASASNSRSISKSNSKSVSSSEKGEESGQDCSCRVGRKSKKRKGMDIKEKEQDKPRIGFFHCEGNACPDPDCQRTLADLHKEHCTSRCMTRFSNDDDDEDEDRDVVME